MEERIRNGSIILKIFLTAGLFLASASVSGASAERRDIFTNVETTDLIIENNASKTGAWS